jgi:hypothetical protein
LLHEAAPILTLAGAILGLYVFSKGRLVQLVVARELWQQRILHRFENEMKAQLERILRELTDPKMTSDVPEPKRPPDVPDPLTDCRKQHPFALVCDEQSESDPEEIVMNFLLSQGIDFLDVLDISCAKFNSFGPGVIHQCSNAPGETWHCTVTIRVKGVTQKRVVSLFRCLCCRADGTTAFVWRGAHWSAGK